MSQFTGRKVALRGRILIGLLLILLAVWINRSVPLLVSSEPQVHSVIRVPEDFATIQEALNAAIPGDTILVSPETYHENIIVDKPISLIGESRENTIIRGPGTGDVVYITSDEVKLDGFTIENSGDDYAGPFAGGDAGVELNHTTNCTVSNLIVTRNTLGISLVSSENNLITNNLVISNGAEGIFLVSSSNNSVINNTSNLNGRHGGIWLALSSNNAIINNTCDSNRDLGIKLHTCKQNTVVNNTCLKNRHTGIFLRSSSNNTLTSNTCNSNNQPGIYLESSSNNLLENNICRFNTDWGIVLRTSSNNNMVVNNTSSSNNHGIDLKSSVGNTLTNNRFSSNNIGITLENSSNNQVSYNTLSMNRIAIGIGVEEVEGARFGNLTGNKMNRNEIYDNAEFGVLNEAPIEVDVFLNWWGDRSGPHHPTSNPHGKGDRVSDNVLFKPWLDAPIGTRGAALRVSDLLISPTEVEIGEAINISVSVTYAGDVTRTFTVALKVNGSVEATKQLTVSGGESAVVTFDVARDVAGTYDVEVDRLAGTFVVRAPRRAQFEVTDLSISPAVAATVCIGVVIIILSLIARSMAK